MFSKITHPVDLRLPPRPGMAPAILTWPAPTAPGMATDPGRSVPISEKDKNILTINHMKH